MAFKAGEKVIYKVRGSYKAAFFVEYNNDHGFEAAELNYVTADGAECQIWVSPSMVISLEDAKKQGIQFSDVDQPMSPQTGPSEVKGVDLISARTELLKLHNEHRVANAKTPPLTADPVLEKAAQDYAQWLADNDKRGHQADGTTVSQRVDKAAKAQGKENEFGGCGENLAYGYANASSAVKGWKSSPGHNNNMLNADGDSKIQEMVNGEVVNEIELPGYHRVGFGYAQSADSTYTYYWCAVFGTPKSEYP